LASFLFLYLGYRRILEPFLMIPMGIGMLAVNAGVLILEADQTGNLFVNPLVSDPTQLINIMQVNFLQPIYNYTFSNGLIACLVFMGIGAITDLDYLMARPMMSMLLAIGAELGTILVLPIGVAAGLQINEAASIALVGGADAPMVLYGSLKMAKDLFVPITVVGYLYLSLCYAGYPYLIKLLIPKKLRGVQMDPLAIPEVSAGKKFAFAVIVMGILCLLFPVAAPLRFLLPGCCSQRSKAHQIRGVPVGPAALRLNALPWPSPGSTAERPDNNGFQGSAFIGSGYAGSAAVRHRRSNRWLDTLQAQQ
jgi:Na+-transporting methylmalonyl-CoA/oxaloacetate decarboxylase beta subunit